MENNFFRVAACSPKVSVANPEENVANIIELTAEAEKSGCDIAVFPELCITGYTCADLFHNRQLLQRSNDAIFRLIDQIQGPNYGMPVVVGAPVEIDGILYNCALVLNKLGICSIIPKTYIPNYNEFYEKRWFAPAPADTRYMTHEYQDLYFGTSQLIEVNSVKVGIEICEDLWTPVPPSCHAAMAGAEVILNLSASDDLIGKYNYVRNLVSQQSARCLCGYAYASAGYGESSTDLVFDGKTMIYENGRELAANKRWTRGNQMVIADIDIMAIRHDRMHYGSFNDCAEHENNKRFTKVSFDYCNAPHKSLMRSVDPTPFVPPTDEAMAERCNEITNIQVAGLSKRLEHIHCKSLVVGISGGLDSTLALLVAVKTFDSLDLPRTGIIGVTMPGFGTTGRTHQNAIRMMEALGITIREIPISPAVMQHFSDIGHDPDVHDVTYENCQARERTQILMDIANQTGGIVLGTGDLSELALGWATYNGDHMSMYGVNAGVPKTLVKYLVRNYADSMPEVRDILLDVIDTPISPELIPAAADGTIKQKTEDLVGPYELHDFFLYYTLRYGFTMQRIKYLAEVAFGSRYSSDEIDKWLKTFMRRFYQQQFKRSCLPDGPKVGSVCLSPRGDWRCPSDASF